MSLFVVDPEKCKRDDICVYECPALIIERKSPDAVPTPTDMADENCINCGHCVAVCPHGAFVHQEVSPEQCPPVRKEWLVGPEQLEHFLRARRSIRTFREKQVERDKLAKLIDIARFAPTGGNVQTPEWLIVARPARVHELSGMVIDWMRDAIKNKPAMADEFDMEDLVGFWENGHDIICRGAPHLIIANGSEDKGTPTEDSIIALTYLELAAFSFGLGACWAGYLNFAINDWPPLKEVLAIPEGNTSFGGLMIGYPKYKYTRLPPRQDARITWI